MTIPHELDNVLASDPEIISGAVRSKGTRVPVQALIDTLDRGTLEEFLLGWPDVSRHQAETVVHALLDQSRPTFGLERAS